MGEDKTRRNLSLDAPDVIAWCIEKTVIADMIIRKGKNWYVYADNVVITINARS